MSGGDDTEVESPTARTKREGPGSPHHVESEPRLERGTLVGRYTIIDVIGEGGMGVVYSAQDPELDRKVAVKLLQAKAGSTGGQAWLLREAQAMARLAHPNVVTVHDVGTLPGDRVFVAMELVDGVTLRAWLRAKPRPWREVMPVMLAAGAGLAAAHATGLVHRDFKPENVIVGADGRVRVMDFGLARLGSDGDVEAQNRSDLQIETKSPLSASLTVAGTVVGTPAYMAPEIYEGHAADARSDQFSFGVALYEVLYRTRPFAKDAPRGSPPKPPPNVGVPARIQRIVMRAISVSPEGRYGSMTELLAKLGAAAAPRRRAMLAIGAIALAGVAIGAVALSRSHAQLCKGADRKLAGVWDPTVKQTVRAAYEATKRPFAAKAFAGLEREIDGYTGKWTATAVDSCEATRIRGEQSEEVLSLRQACLDQRLEELHALVRLLAQADGDLVDKAETIVWNLEPLTRCSNVALLRAPGREPTEPKAKIDELNAALAEAKAQLIAARYFPALVASKKVVDLAEQVHYEPFKAEALLVSSTSLLAVGNTEDATAAVAEASWAALRGHRDDVLAGSAISAAVVASDGKVGEARIWIGLAKAALARLGHDPKLEQRMLEVEGLVAAMSGDMATATAVQQKALDVAEATYGRDNPVVWSDEEVVGTTLEKIGACDKAMPHLESALALHEKSVGPDHPDIANLLTNLGACYSHAHEAAKAQAAYEHAIAIYERVYGPQSPQLIATLNNMADGLTKAGDVANGLHYAERATELADKLLGRANPLTQAIETTHAEVLAAAGRIDEARKELDDIITNETKARSATLPGTLSSRATIEIGAKQWAAASGFAQRAISELEKTSGKEAPDLEQPLVVLGRAYVELGKSADARPLVERAIAIGTKAQASSADLAPARALLEKIDAK